MSATHTPGPWKAAGAPNSDGDICIWDRESDWAVAIACADGHAAEVAANARLIAMAPTMYEFVRSMLNPEENGHAVTAYVRNQARKILGIESREPE